MCVWGLTLQLLLLYILSKMLQCSVRAPHEHWPAEAALCGVRGIYLSLRYCGRGASVTVSGESKLFRSPGCFWSCLWFLAGGVLQIGLGLSWFRRSELHCSTVAVSYCKTHFAAGKHSKPPYTGRLLLWKAGCWIKWNEQIMAFPAGIELKHWEISYHNGRAKGGVHVWPVSAFSTHFQKLDSDSIQRAWLSEPNSDVDVFVFYMPSPGQGKPWEKTEVVCQLLWAWLKHSSAFERKNRKPLNPRLLTMAFGLLFRSLWRDPPNKLILLSQMWRRPPKVYAGVDFGAKLGDFAEVFFVHIHLGFSNRFPFKAGCISFLHSLLIKNILNEITDRNI